MAFHDAVTSAVSDTETFNFHLISNDEGINSITEAESWARCRISPIVTGVQPSGPKIDQHVSISTAAHLIETGDLCNSAVGLQNSLTEARSSSPPLFAPPSLPCSIAVHSSNRSVQTLHPTPRLPSSFPSPYSAFTELQPKALRSASTKSPQTRGLSSAEPNSTSHHRPLKPGANVPALPVSCFPINSLASMATAHCLTCGQTHDPNGPHRYNYTQSVDADLCCMLCHQPLVTPLDTKCGHTFCTPCLKSHLTVQALCPVDRQIINYLECQQASNIVKRLLDKLLVACPCTQFCNTILPRCELQEHLRDWCAGTIVPCENAGRGCTFVGPRVLYLRHRCHTAIPSVPVVTRPLDTSVGPNFFCPVPNQLGKSDVSSRTASLHRSPGLHRIPLKCEQLRSEPKSPLSDIDETYDSPTITEGLPVSIVIRRNKTVEDWGFTFVGGIDTPLTCILVQEIYLDGAVACDGRLRPGDQLVEVDGRPLVAVTHAEARLRLSTRVPIMQLVVFRESFSWRPNRNWRTSHYEEERFQVKLCKQRSKVLGIKLVGKKHRPGLYVLELVAGCEAQLDGRLRKDDRILEINGVDLTEGTQEQAATIINSASDFVEFKVSRRLRADTPDIVRITSHSSASTTSLPRGVQSFRSTSRAVTRNSSLNRCSSEQPKLRKCESEDHVTCDLKRVPSPATMDSSRVTELSSLNADPVSSETDMGSESASKPASEEDRGGPSALPIDPRPGANDAVGVIKTEARSELIPCRENIVVIEKALEEPLGISVAGGRHSQRGDTPIYVTNIRENSVLGRSKLIKRGDVLLEVNNTGLVGLTHQEAVDVLRSSSSGCGRIQIRLVEAPETCNGPGNFLPSWTFWIKLPPVCQLTHVVQLRRDKSVKSGYEPLGFSILGGTEQEVMLDKTTGMNKRGYESLYPNPVVVKSIVPGLLAHRDGRLKCGDLILAVNNISMLDVSHETAVRVLKTLAQDVELRIISWPGTIV